MKIDLCNPVMKGKALARSSSQLGFASEGEQVCAHQPRRGRGQAEGTLRQGQEGSGRGCQWLRGHAEAVREGGMPEMLSR